MNDNTVNDVQTEAVGGQGTGESASEVAETEETTLSNEPEEVAKPQQSREDNKAFAEMRRAREKAEREASEAQAKLNSVVNFSKTLGFEGNTPDDVLIAMEAHAKGVTPETVIAEREKIKQEALNSPEYKEVMEENKVLREERLKSIMESDLKAIQAIDPNVKSLSDLGDDYFNLVSNGYEGVKAYKMVKAITETKPVVQTGAVKADAIQEKDYYTVEEVRAMQPREVEKNLDKIQKSMTKWR